MSTEQPSIDDLGGEDHREEDPPLSQTDWSPLKGGGANFTTHRLEGVSPDRIEFKPTLLGRLFGWFFLIPGIPCLAVGVYLLVIGAGWPSLIVMGFGAIFSGVGWFILRRFTTPIVFDRSLGLYWKGREQPRPEAQLENGARFDDIHAIQLLSEWVQSTNSDGRTTSYHSYEVNLVLGDGRRLNVVDHGGEQKARADAQQLAEFLGKPLWDRA